MPSHLNKNLTVQDLKVGDVLYISPKEFYLILESDQNSYKELDLRNNRTYNHPFLSSHTKINPNTKKINAKIANILYVKS